MFEIGKVADTVVEMCGLVGKGIDAVWKYYIHDLVKESHSLEEIKAYIKHKQEFGAGLMEEGDILPAENVILPGQQEDT